MSTSAPSTAIAAAPGPATPAVTPMGPAAGSYYWPPSWDRGAASRKWRTAELRSIDVGLAMVGHLSRWDWHLFATLTAAHQTTNEQYYFERFKRWLIELRDHVALRRGLITIQDRDG